MTPITIIGLFLTGIITLSACAQIVIERRMYGKPTRDTLVINGLTILAMLVLTLLP